MLLIKSKAHKLAIELKNYSNIFKSNNKSIFFEKSEEMVKEFNKSHSNTSTTSVESVESGVFEMGSSEVPMNIGDTIKMILEDAQKNGRLICGLNDAAKHLTETEEPENSLFFFVAPSNVGDHSSHMSSIFLRAFCFENDIYIIQVDSAEKLNRILGSKSNHTCALVQRTLLIHDKNQSQIYETFTELETALIDHCEDFWDEPVQPIIRLPEK